MEIEDLRIGQTIYDKGKEVTIVALSGQGRVEYMTSDFEIKEVEMSRETHDLSLVPTAIQRVRRVYLNIYPNTVDCFESKFHADGGRLSGCIDSIMTDVVYTEVI